MIAVRTTLHREGDKQIHVTFLQTYYEETMIPASKRADSTAGSHLRWKATRVPGAIYEDLLS